MPSGLRVCWAQSLTRPIEWVTGRGRGQGHPLVVELVGHQRPPAVELADEVLLGHPHVLVVGRAGPDAGDRVDRREGEALAVGGHQDHREALVTGQVGVGAAGQPDVVGVLDQRGPHLLAVDHPLVALQPRPGLQAGEVGARTRLRVADREVHLALEDLRQDLGLLRVGAEAHDRGPDRVERQVGDRHPGDGRLVGEDELVHHRPVLAAVLLRPADAQPAVVADLLDDFLVDRRVPELAGRRRQRRTTLGGHERLEVVPELGAELLLLGCQCDVHEAPDQRSTGSPIGRWTVILPRKTITCSCFRPP